MMRQVNILLVEDDELDIMNVRRAFRDAPNIGSITVARDGVEALKLLRGGNLPLNRLLVLLDLRMPRMNGLEFLQHIRHDGVLNLLPVVILTTSNDSADLARAYQLHVAGYLLKPVSLTQFRDCMQRLQQYFCHVEFPWEPDVH
jgi:CheY-like chemotaxis protein